jgi:hypothetical protein
MIAMSVDGVSECSDIATLGIDSELDPKVQKRGKMHIQGADVPPTQCYIMPLSVIY